MRFLARKIGFQLSQKPDLLRTSFHDLLAESTSQISISIGISVLLGDPLAGTIHQPDVDTSILPVIRQHRPAKLSDARSLDISCGDHPRTHVDSCAVHTSRNFPMCSPAPFCFGSEPGREPFALVYGFTGTFTLVDQVWCHSKLLTLMERS